MPWSVGDVDKHNKGLSDEQKKQWVAVANKVLDETGDEASAIKQANAAVKKGNRMEKDDDNVHTREGGLSIVARSFDMETRTADAIISVGARVRRRDWDTEYDEVLDMTPGAVRLGRLNAGAQLLDGHMFWRGLDSILGSVVPGTARLEGGKLYAKFKFSRSDMGQRLARDLADGHQFLLSTGYKTHKETRDATTTPETRYATDWEPLEVSVVPVAAEGGETGFRSLHSTGHRPHKETAMDGKDKGSTGAAAKEQQTRSEEEIRTAEAKAAADKQRAEEIKRVADEEIKKRVEAENTRVNDILETAKRAGLSVEHAQKAIKEGVTIDKYREQVIDAMAERQKQQNGATSGAHQDSNSGGRFDPVTGRVVRDEMEGAAEAMSEAIQIRILSSRRDVPGVKSAEQAEWLERMGRVDMVKQSRLIFDGREKPQNERTRQFLGMSIAEMAAQCINWRGPILPRTVPEILTRAFQSTGDYANIFSNALNKSLLARYQLAMPTYRQLAIERPFNDFRPHPQIRAGEFPTLLPLTETGEIQAGASADSKETVSVTPYGRTFNISRQMMVNDEMGAIDQILASAGDMVLIFENTTFFTMMLQASGGGPTLATDSTAVFHANHGNLVSPGGNPSILTISAARKAIRAQQSLSGNKLNVPPAMIVTGPGQETVAEQMLATIQPVTFGTVNPFSGTLRKVTDNNIPGDAWYVFCEPGQLPCFIYGFLAGATGPRTRTDEPFGYQGLRTSIEHDFGCGAIDFRGAWRNEGTGPSGAGY